MLLQTTNSLLLFRIPAYYLLYFTPNKVMLQFYPFML